MKMFMAPASDNWEDELREVNVNLTGATGWQPAPCQKTVPQSGRMIEYTDEEREMLKSPTVKTKAAAQYLGMPSQKLIWLMCNSPRACKIGEVKLSPAGTRHPVIFTEKLIAYKHGLDIPDDFLDDEEEITDRLERIETAIQQILNKLEVR